MCRNYTRLLRFTLAILLAFEFSSTAFAQWAPMNPVVTVQPQPDGVILAMKSGTLRLQVCSDSIVHVLYSPTTSFPASRPDPVVIKTTWPATKFTMQDNSGEITLTTSQLKVVVTRKDGAITYRDLAGKQLVQEATRKLTPVKVNGEDTYHAESFVNIYGSREAFYGLGQHQAGVWNYRGESVDISQDNSNIAVPFLVSSNGYGIFWNNDSRSRFNNRFANYLYISSEVADVIDYYFFYGPNLDKVIAAYRELTGQAPMFGKWATVSGSARTATNLRRRSWEWRASIANSTSPPTTLCRTGSGGTARANSFSTRTIPTRRAMVDELHRENFHLMISIWPFFEPGSANYDYMDKQGWFIDKFKFAKPPYHTEGMAVYDATSPEARKFYWNLVDQGLFKIGVDAWWMDTTEPETEGQEENIQLGHKLAIGSGDRYVNVYPLLDTGAVYNGQRAASDQKRVYILSRSAFAGSQRNAVTAWSGDINSDWLSFRRQIPAGLNFALSGIPYWTTDIGGFVSADPDDPAYRELFVRWFQFGTFNPILRVHGTRKTDQNELWSYGPDAQKILVSFDRLRYRLLPYTYSLAWKTTNDSYTPMRPLVMDFRDDVRAQNTGDEYMYGPAFLVNPVTEPAATSRRVYLPEAKWYDFWNGASVDGKREITAEAPLDELPLYIRAGSIVPFGPDVEWSTEKPADPIELRIYRGADGEFTLYEDENDNYDYEKGVHATIPFRWDDAKRTLTIGDRQGEFPGMLSSRTFHIVFVSENHGVGIAPCDTPDKVVEYSGKQVSVTP